jgi:hypothetical protein
MRTRSKKLSTTDGGRNKFVAATKKIHAFALACISYQTPPNQSELAQVENLAMIVPAKQEAQKNFQAGSKIRSLALFTSRTFYHLYSGHNLEADMSVATIFSIPQPTIQLPQDHLFKESYFGEKKVILARNYYGTVID